jgi:hypothetical protein
VCLCVCRQGCSARKLGGLLISFSGRRARGVLGGEVRWHRAGLIRMDDERWRRKRKRKPKGVKCLSRIEIRYARAFGSGLDWIGTNFTCTDRGCLLCSASFPLDAMRCDAMRCSRFLQIIHCIKLRAEHWSCFIIIIIIINIVAGLDIPIVEPTNNPPCATITVFQFFNNSNPHHHHLPTRKEAKPVSRNDQGTCTVPSMRLPTVFPRIRDIHVYAERGR